MAIVRARNRRREPAHGRRTSAVAARETTGRSPKTAQRRRTKAGSDCLQVRSASSRVGGMAKTSDAIISSRPTPPKRCSGSIASANPRAAVLCTLLRLKHARAPSVRRAALSEQLQLPARRIASRGACHARACTRLQRDCDHRFVLGRRRCARACRCQEGRPQAHHRNRDHNRERTEARAPRNGPRELLAACVR
jgi:hypothetical protein